jgi:hypothetical protein
MKDILNVSAKRLRNTLFLGLNIFSVSLTRFPEEGNIP